MTKKYLNFWEDDRYDCPQKTAAFDEYDEALEHAETTIKNSNETVKQVTIYTRAGLTKSEQIITHNTESEG